MLVIFIFFALLVLGVIIYFAVSPRSPLPVRIAALAALGLSVLSVVVSLALIFLVRGAGPGDPDVEYIVPVEKTPPQSSDLLVLLFFTILMLVLLGVVIVISLRDRKKVREKERAAA
jgi:amino acid transporter